MTEPLDFTGERFTPECVREIRYEHIHRYAFAAELVAGRDVLDAACGEGYGSNILATRARSVTGVDIAPQVIEHATSRYHCANLSFQAGDCSDLPFEDGRFGAIVSFETLEHLASQDRLVAEFRRVLADEGFLVISSPDRDIYSGRLGNDNPHHVCELNRPELQHLLATRFPAVRLLGQRLGFHSLLWSLAGNEAGSGLAVHREGKDGIERMATVGGEAVYLIALCAARPEYLPELDSGVWLFDDEEETVYSHYHHEIRKNMRAGAILAERDRELETLRAALGDEAAGSRRSTPERAQAARPWWRRLLGR